MTAPAWAIAPSEDRIRKEIHGHYGGSSQNGISFSARTPNILVYSDHEKASRKGDDFVRSQANSARDVDTEEMSDDLLAALETGTRRGFAEWPDPSVPKIAAGVYTIWDEDQLIYVGMAGRAITAERTSTKPTGLWDRLRSHADGRRSGNQFCIYVCDRFIVPNLYPEQQAQIGAGALSLDHLTRRYIQDKLAYRYVLTPTPAEARSLEQLVQSGALQAGAPLLNPLRGTTPPAMVAKDCPVPLDSDPTPADEMSNGT